MPQRLLVLSASIGAGHVKAAEALCSTFREMYPEGEAFHLDFLKYCGPKFSKLIEESYYFITKNMAGVYRFLYDFMDRPESITKRNQVLLALRKYRKLVGEYKPDLILSTYFFPASVISYYYEQIPIPNGVVITDYEAHPMWVYSNVNRYFVAHRDMLRELGDLGVPEEKVRVTGIPVRPEFGLTPDPAELRREKNIPRDIPVLLVMSGGNAIGPLCEILKVLNEVDGEFYTIVITGKNEKVRRELEASRGSFRRDLRILGFVEDMHKWMYLADLLVSKAGGLTVSEALAVGLPMLVIKPTPGQEEANTRFLLRNEAGFYLQNVGELRESLNSLFSNRDKLRVLREKARSLGRPQAARDILVEITNLLK